MERVRRVHVVLAFSLLFFPSEDIPNPPVVGFSPSSSRTTSTWDEARVILLRWRRVGRNHCGSSCPVGCKSRPQFAGRVVSLSFPSSRPETFRLPSLEAHLHLRWNEVLFGLRLLLRRAEKPEVDPLLTFRRREYVTCLLAPFAAPL